MGRMGRSLALMGLLLFGVLSAACGKPIVEQPKDTAYEVVDVRGDTVRFSAKPKRVLTFTTGADEVVLGLVKPERMIAVNQDFVDPARSNVAALARQVPNTIERNPAVERVAALQPDLVIVQDWISMDKVQALRDLGISVVVTRTPRSIEEVRATIRLIAASLGEIERGERLVTRMNEELTAIEGRIAQVPAEQK